MGKQIIDIKDFKKVVEWSQVIGIKPSDFLDYAIHLGIRSLDEMLRDDSGGYVKGFLGGVYKGKSPLRKR